MNKELAEILATMDIPQARAGDVYWLSRNLPIRNSRHTKIERAMELIKAEIRRPTK